MRVDPNSSPNFAPLVGRYLPSAELHLLDKANDLWTRAYQTFSNFVEHLRDRTIWVPTLDEEFEPAEIPLSAVEMREPGEELLRLLFETEFEGFDNDGNSHARWPVQLISVPLLNDLIGTLSTLDDDKIDALPAYFNEWLQHFSDQVEDALISTDFRTRDTLYFVPALPRTPSNLLIVKRIEDKAEAIRLQFKQAELLLPSLDRVQRASLEVEQTSNALRNMAGGVASSEIATHFTEAAKKEENGARLWTSLAAGCLMGVSVIAALTLYGAPGSSDNGSADWKIQALHLVLTVPLAALAAYSSRVASRHRQQAWWARTVAAQLHSVNVYASPLDEASRTKLLSDMGRRVFVEPAMNISEVEPDSASTLALLNELAERLQPIAEVVERLKPTKKDES